MTKDLGEIIRFFLTWIFIGLRKAVLVVVIVLLSFASFGEDARVHNRDSYPTVDEKVLEGIVRTKFDSPNPTQAQLDRRAKSLRIVEQMGIPYIEHLPVVEDAAMIIPRTQEEIVQRCLAVAICAVKGETNDQAIVEKVITKYTASPFFSPKEWEFIQNLHPEEQQRVNFAWGYERAHVLLWALGYIEELKPPSQICDVPNEMGMIWKEDKGSFRTNARLRPLAEILDLADLYYRLNWGAVELRLRGEVSEVVNEEIVMERHYALNWLIRYMGQEWDDITTDT